MDKLVRKIEVPIAKKYITKNGLYIVSKKELKQLAKVAADAYKDYPLHNWFCNEKYNEKISYKIMLVSLRTMFKDGVIYADSPELNGFCIWLPFGFTGSKTLPFLLSGGISIIFRGGIKIVKKLITFENFAMKLKQKYTDNMDWYLYNLSIKQEAQGKGIASKLIKPMLTFCDLEQMVCYLETNKEKNLSLYKHYGFELMEEQLVPSSNVIHYSMSRKPNKID